MLLPEESVRGTIIATESSTLFVKNTTSGFELGKILEAKRAAVLTGIINHAGNDTGGPPIGRPTFMGYRTTGHSNPSFLDFSVVCPSYSAVLS